MTKQGYDGRRRPGSRRQHGDQLGRLLCVLCESIETIIRLRATPGVRLARVPALVARGRGGRFPHRR